MCAAINGCRDGGAICADRVRDPEIYSCRQRTQIAATASGLIVEIGVGAATGSDIGIPQPRICGSADTINGDWCMAIGGCAISYLAIII